MLARRLHGKYTMSTPVSLIERVQEIENGVYEEGFNELMSLSKDNLKKRYTARDFVDQKKAG